MCTPANRSKSRALHTQQQERLEILDEEEAASHRAEADTCACQVRHSELIMQCERLQSKHAVFDEELKEADTGLSVVSQDERNFATDLQLLLVREEEVRAVESEEFARLIVENSCLESEASEALTTRHSVILDPVEESAEACMDSWIAAREVAEARRVEFLHESGNYSARHLSLEAELPDLRATVAGHEKEAEAAEVRVHKLEMLVQEKNAEVDSGPKPAGTLQLGVNSVRLDWNGHPSHEGKQVSVQSIWALETEAEEALNSVRSLEQALEAARAGSDKAVELVAGSNPRSWATQMPKSEFESVLPACCEQSSMPDVGMRLQMRASSWCQADLVKDIIDVRHFGPISQTAPCGSGTTEDDSLDPYKFEDPTAATRLMVENSRLREQLSELTKESRRQPLGTAEDDCCGQAWLAAPIIGETHARLQAAMLAQVQESREAVACLQHGLKDSKLRLQRERRLREHSERLNSERRESREPVRAVGLDMLQRQAGPDWPSSGDDSDEGDVSLLGLRRKLLAR